MDVDDSSKLKPTVQRQYEEVNSEQRRTYLKASVLVHADYRLSMMIEVR